ncbi:MORN repeat-containing protein 1 isoform X3 [Calonectris borealis]|uniref:MORN repeat-containing protein 1 isoform X3 n=1 Tax=Calonectris borealis TaxID=1323832 RepID=UPI003F4C8345
MKRTTAEQILILQPLEDPTSAVNSRRLEIWAGIRNHQIPSHSATNLFKLIEETERKTVNSCKGGKKPSGRISAEKAEKMTVSQEKMEDSRSHMTSKEYKLQKDQHLRKNSKTLQGNQLDEKVDLSLSVNLISSGPTGRMSYIIENAFPKTKCIRKMSLFFSAAVMEESTV